MVTNLRSSAHWLPVLAVLLVTGSCGSDRDPLEPTDDPREPVLPSVIRSDLATGTFFSCAIGSDSLTYCWGANHFGQLGSSGQEQTAVPTPVEGGHRFMAITASSPNSVVGPFFACGLTNEGKAWCWGAADIAPLKGQGESQCSFLFGPNTVNRPCVRRPVPIADSLRWITLQAGGTHLCGVSTDGDLLCWGENNFGQVGDGTTVEVPAPTRITIPGSVISVAPGPSHSCALTADGAAYCWGVNSNGQLGIGSLLPALSPERVLTDIKFTSLAVGSNFTCGIVLDRTAYCWGWLRGLVEVPPATVPELARISPVPAPLRNSPQLLTLASSLSDTCAVGVMQKVWCWGLNGNFQHGDEASMDSVRRCVYGTQQCVPRPFGADIPMRMVQGGGLHMCGRGLDTQVWCWGGNAFGERGEPNAKSPVAEPARVPLP